MAPAQQRHSAKGVLNQATRARSASTVWLGNRWHEPHMTTHSRFKPEQDAVEALIRRAFRGVTREGGVSWSEADAIDSTCDESKWALARALDTEASWEELIDDPKWDYDSTGGGFNFLDAIGWRYYIAPAMIRCVRKGGGEFVGYALEVRDQGRLFSKNQNRATARFVRYMVDVHKAVGNDIYGASWVNAYEGYWKQFDEGATS